MTEYVRWDDVVELRRSAALVIDNAQAYLTLYNGINRLKHVEIPDEGDRIPTECPDCHAKLTGPHLPTCRFPPLIQHAMKVASIVSELPGEDENPEGQDQGPDQGPLFLNFGEMIGLNRSPADWEAERRAIEAERERKEKERFEKLAALEHEHWAFWTRSIVADQRPGRPAIPDWLVKKWKAGWVPYEQLTEEVKEQDRVWARRAIVIMEER